MYTTELNQQSANNRNSNIVRIQTLFQSNAFLNEFICCRLVQSHRFIHCRGNLKLCLLVGYGEDEEDGRDLLNHNKEKLPVLYYSIRIARCEKGRLYCIIV